MFTHFPPELVWFITGFIFLLGELALPSFILIFFGIGAWLTMLAVFIGMAPNIISQLIFFIIFSLLALILFRKKRSIFANDLVIKETDSTQDISSNIGSHGFALENLEPNSTGKVELNGTPWQAVTEVFIAKDTEVVIIDQVNLTLKVKPFI